MGLSLFLPVKLPITIDTMLNFDGHCDGDGNGVGMCKHTFTGVTVDAVVMSDWIDSPTRHSACPATNRSVISLLLSSESMGRIERLCSADDELGYKKRIFFCSKIIDSSVKTSRLFNIILLVAGVSIIFTVTFFFATT